MRSVRLPPGRHPLPNEFNRVLNQMRDECEITRLVEPFGLAEAAEAARGLTADRLCTG